MQELKKWHDWEVTKFLGQGSFGKVYQIERTAYGHTYKSALKVMRIPADPQQYDNLISTGMTHEDAKEFFNDMAESISSEFALMSEFRGNSNIVSFEDFEVIPEEDGYSVTIYIRMELLEPLIHYMKSNSMTRNDVVQLGCDVLKALELCEQRSIIHRDIKPENVFRSDQGTFKLGDFGIARELDRSDSGMSKKGTVSYMAPEVYRGLPYGSNVDIYSLGIMLYRLMNNNRLPFMPPYPEKIKFTDTEQANVRRIAGEALPLPCNAEDDLGEIILRACSYDPEKRYQSASEMREDLEKLMAGTYQPLVKADDEDDAAEATVGYPLAPAEAEIAEVDEKPVEEASSEIPPEKKKQKKAKEEKENNNDKAASEKKTGKKIGIGKILGIAAAAIVLLVVVIIASSAMGKVEIAGDKVDKDRTSLFFVGDEINGESLKNLNKLSKLEKIEFEDCTITNDGIEALGNLKTGVTRLIIHDCTGFDDISALADMPFLGFLNISSCALTDEMLSGMDFSKMDNLVALRIHNSPEVTTIAPLEPVIPQLKGLSISRTSVSDISSLGNAGELKVLLAAGCGIEDISMLKAAGMKAINIADNKVSDIGVVKDMPELTALEITDNNVSDLSPLAGMESLDTLRANGNNISDLSPLASCSALKTLQICGNGLESLESLSGHSSLIDFYANDNDLTSLKGLESELELTCLSASGNQLADMEGAENFTQLQTVNLEDNEIEDFSLLKKSLNSLEWVDISGNPAGSLDVLSGTSHLTGLYCDDTGIDSLEPVKGNPDLKEISAQNNKISSIEALADKPSLIAVDLSGNSISDMTPLTQAVYDSMDELTIDLQDNNISTMLFPEKEGVFKLQLAIEGNPVTDAEVSTVQKGDGINSDFLGITYYDGMENAEWSSWLNAGTYVYITDCPMDRQVALKDALREAVLDDNINYCQKSDIEEYIAPALYEVKKGNATVKMNEMYGKNAEITEDDEDKEIQEIQGQI